MARKKKFAIPGVEITGYAAEGKSIAQLEDGKVLFVENAIPGDIVDVFVSKNKKSWAEGKVTRLVKASPKRITPFCEHFGICGGCKWQMLPYEYQLQYKQQQVEDQLRRIGHISFPDLIPISGSARQKYYRNKLEFTFSKHKYRTVEELQEAGDARLEPEPSVGFHAPGLFDKVVPVNQCYLQADPSNLILNTLRDFAELHKLDYYDFRAQQGWLRNVVIRVASTGQVLVNLVVKTFEKKILFAMLDDLLEKVPQISSLNYTINPKVNDTINDLEVVCYKGKAHIQERLEDFIFNISPKSFFQTNTGQAENLYAIARDFAGLSGEETLYDLYCGTGSIGIFCSKKARKIIGIEVIEQAIEDARVNAQVNGLDNCVYYAGDVSAICDDAFFEQHGKPDVIITDPPRAGMHEKLVHQLLKMQAPKVVYISCNPATQARDLQLLDAAYKITKVQPVDMFPHTHHIENVVLLELR